MDDFAAEEKQEKKHTQSVWGIECATVKDGGTQTGLNDRQRDGGWEGERKTQREQEDEVSDGWSASFPVIKAVTEWMGFQGQVEAWMTDRPRLNVDPQSVGCGLLESQVEDDVETCWWYLHSIISTLRLYVDQDSLTACHS